MDNEQVLKIVLKAQDEASAAFRKAAAEVDKLQKTIKDGTDGASDSLEKAGKSASFFSSHIQDAGLAAAGVLASIGALTKSMIDVTATMEQNKIAFTTMIGNAQLAGKTLKELSDFAAATPFELPQVIEGSKQLLAYGIQAKELIPTFKNLGNIAAGVGTEKLPNLILAFGQVKAATHLTGAELRQFSEAGVPLLDALVKQANAAGGSWQTVGGNAKKAKVDVAEVTEKIGILNQKMAENHEKYKEGSVAYREAQLQLKKLNDQIADAGDTTEGTRRVWVKTTVTADDMIDKISKGEVSFEDMQKALEGMTEKGGKFFNLMEKQSQSFSGIMSNMRDNLTRLSMQIMGMSEDGEVRKGSMFYYLKEGAQRLLVVMNDLRPQLTTMADAFFQNKTAVMTVVGAIGGLLVLAIGAAIVAFGPALAIMAAFALAGAGIVGTITELNEKFDLFKSKQDLVRDAHQKVTDAVNDEWSAYKNLMTAKDEMENAALRAEGAALREEQAQRTLTATLKRYGPDSLEARQAAHDFKQAHFDTAVAFDAAKKKMAEFDKDRDIHAKKTADTVKAQQEETKAVEAHATAWDRVWGAMKSAFDWYNKLSATMNKASGGDLLKGLKMPGFAEGTSFAPGGLALVGERGPELVNLPRGSQVIPNNKTEQIFNGGNVNIAAVYVRSESDIQTMAQQMAFYMKTRGNL